MRTVFEFFSYKIIECNPQLYLNGLYLHVLYFKVYTTLDIITSFIAFTKINYRIF